MSWSCQPGKSIYTVYRKWFQIRTFERGMAPFVTMERLCFIYKNPHDRNSKDLISVLLYRGLETIKMKMLRMKLLQRSIHFFMCRSVKFVCAASIFRINLCICHVINVCMYLCYDVTMKMRHNGHQTPVATLWARSVAEARCMGRGAWRKACRFVDLWN